MERADLIEQKLASLLQEVPPSERKATMVECEQLANGNLNLHPSRSSPQQWAADVMSDPGMISLARRSRDSGTNPEFAESPQDLILRLLPSDGHLE